MLSSPRWTIYDLCAFAVLLSLCARVFGESTTPEEIARQPTMVNIISVPLPYAQSSRSLDYPVQMEAALRCAGLGQMLGTRRCKDCDTSLAYTLRQRIRSYARAYRDLGRDHQASSQLILRRDSAMCSQYPEFREAGLHEHQERQSRRSL